VNFRDESASSAPPPHLKLWGITDLENYANRVKAIFCKMQRNKGYGSLRKSSLVFSFMTIINEAEDLRHVKISREMGIPGTLHWDVVCRSRIANTAGRQNFQITSDKFNVRRIFMRVKS
jgi:hypothetical protein